MTDKERLQNMQEFRDSEKTILSILAMPEVFDKTPEEEIQQIGNIPSGGKYNTIYKLGRDESLERIAVKYAVTQGQIITRNRLEYPYLQTEKQASDRVDSDNPNIKYAGESILIPTTSFGGFEKDNSLQQTIWEKEFGVDFLVDHDTETGTMDFLEEEDGSDVQIIYGPSMVAQGINTMLSTKRNRFIDFPFYGNSTRFGQKMDIFRIGFDRVQLRNSILLDDRLTYVRVDRITTKKGVVEYVWSAQIRDIGKEITGEVPRI